MLNDKWGLHTVSDHAFPAFNSDNHFDAPHPDWQETKESRMETVVDI